MKKILFFTIALFVVSFSFSQDFVIDNTTTFPDVYWGDYSIAGDIDNDGDEDLFISSQTESNVWISRLYKNDGFGNFTVSQNFAPLSYQKSIFKDIDEDGDLDLFVMGSEPGASWNYHVYLYRNDGNGYFYKNSYETFVNLIDGDFDLADIDGDGDMDLLYNGSYDSTANYVIGFYRNDGNGNFSRDTTHPFYDSAHGTIDFFDANNDGDMDVFITGRRENGSLFSKLYHNDGNGNFSTSSQTFAAVQYAAVTIYDINNDGDLDIVYVGSNSSDELISRVYRNNGSGTFSYSSTDIAGASLRINANHADIDNDGDDDLCIGNRIYKNDGSGNFTFYTSILSGRDRSLFINANGDNAIDVFATFKLYLNYLCIDPSNLNSNSYGTNTVDLTWQETGSSTSWELEIGPHGFSATGNATHFANSNPYTFNTATNDQLYDFYVRSVCYSGFSNWVGPYTFSQSTTYVPSFNFENYLETHDANGDLVALGDANSMGNGIQNDDTVFTARIQNVTNLDVSSLNISTLTGIQDFTALSYLDCGTNNISTLNVSNLSNLQTLYCKSNNITSIMLPTTLTALERLSFRENNLTVMDISQYPNITLMRFDNNNLTELNVKNGNNTNVTTFNATGNSNLTCVKVDDLNYSNTNWVNIDGQTSFNESCDTTYVPDDNFEQALIDLGYDTVLDDYVFTDNISTIWSLTIRNKNISDLTGIEDFSSLDRLFCDNNQLTSIELSTNINITQLGCNDNLLTSLDLSANTALRDLVCSNNNLTTINVNANINLLTVLCDNNQLTNLNLSSNTSLEYLYCQNNNLIKLNVKNGNNNSFPSGLFKAYNNPNLICIEVDDAIWSTNNWTEIDAQTSFSEHCETFVPDNNFEQALIDLGYDDFLDDWVTTTNINTVTNLDISNLGISDLTGIEAFTALEIFNCSGNQFVEIDLTTNVELTHLYCYNNTSAIDHIDTSNNISLQVLHCNNSNITTLDLATNTLLQDFNCANNFLSSLNLSLNTALTVVNCLDNQLTELNIKNGTNTIITNFDATNNPNLWCIKVDDENYATTNWLNIDAQTQFNENCAKTYVPDNNFEQALIDLGYDDFLDDWVITANINTVTNLDISNLGISDLTGIEDFIALEEFNFSGNIMSNLELTNPLLTHLYWNNVIQGHYLDISACTNLEVLECINAEIDLEIDLSANTLLTHLYCQDNNLEAIDLTNNTVLQVLNCADNIQISNLNLSLNTALTEVNCANNQINSLDLSLNAALTKINCADNQLTDVNIKNSTNNIITNFDTTNNPNLWCIKVDDENYATINWLNIDAHTQFSENCAKTFVSDNNFEQELIDLGYDDVLDDYVYTIHIDEITTLDLSNKSINSLTGIEDFIALQELNINANSISNLNLTNSQLTHLYFNDAVNANYFNVAACENLEVLEFNNSDIAENIDLSNNITLTHLSCQNNNFPTLNLVNNTALQVLNCSNNNISELNIKNGTNTIITNFDATNNPNLTCINVDDATYSTNNWVNIDAQTSFDENCLVLCLSGNIILNTQQEVDDFLLNYPTCTSINGNVTIDGNNINNLDSFTQITQIMGTFTIRDNPILNNLLGLSNLEFIDLNFDIINNSMLTNLSGLNVLTEVDRLEIKDNVSLVSFTGLEALNSVNLLIIENNDALINCTGLETLTTAYVEGIGFIGNASLVDFTGLDNLTNYNGLMIDSNPNLSSLNGLQIPSILSNGMGIGHNPQLTDISQLSNLIQALNIYIDDNDALLNLNGLQNLTTISGEIGVHHNALLNNISALASLNYVADNLYISYNDALQNTTGLGALTYVGKDLSFTENSSLISINDLDALTTIEEDLRIENNNLLKDVSGFTSLTTINDAFKIYYNDVLTDLSGFEVLNYVGGYFHIKENMALTSIDQLTALSEVGGTFYIQNNDALVEITNLNNLTSVGSSFRIKYNGALINISQAFQNLNSIGADLEIRYNTLLSSCEAYAICNYLETPAGAVIISNNAIGCNSETEISNACNDTTPPTVITQNITIQLDANNTASIMANQINNGSTDNITVEENLLFALDITDFDCSNIGENTVILIVTDAVGNAASNTATVTVEDITNPETPILADVTEECSASVTTPTTTDNCAGTITGTTTDELIYTEQGTYVVTWTFDDGNGNSINVNQNVIINDIINPVVITQDIEIDLNGESSIIILPEDVDNGSSDNCGFTLSLDIDTFISVGIFTVELTATDNSSNSITETAEVTVIDSTVGIENMVFNSLAIYPNPSENIFSVFWNREESIQIQVFDISGKIILDTIKIDKLYILDMTNYESGIYFMKIQVKGNKTIKKLILK